MNATTLTQDYLGYKTMSSYNVTECAMICDAMETCVAFNTFFERNPTLNPNATEGCPNPPSTTNIKCAWWSTPINETSATNSGEKPCGFPGCDCWLFNGKLNSEIFDIQLAVFICRLLPPIMKSLDVDVLYQLTSSDCR